MAPKIVADTCECPAESSCQKQAEGAVWSPPMEEDQSTDEATTQGKLALDQEHFYTSVIVILGAGTEVWMEIV